MQPLRALSLGWHQFNSVGSSELLVIAVLAGEFHSLSSGKIVISLHGPGFLFSFLTFFPINLVWSLFFLVQVFASYFIPSLMVAVLWSVVQYGQYPQFSSDFVLGVTLFCWELDPF